MPVNSYFRPEMIKNYFFSHMDQIFWAKTVFFKTVDFGENEAITTCDFLAQKCSTL